MRVKLKDLLYERGEVILTGEALGIYKTTGEKYYVEFVKEYYRMTGRDFFTQKEDFVRR